MPDVGNLDREFQLSSKLPPRGKREAASIIMRMRIIVRCRELMISGNFRPTSWEIPNDKISRKALRHHFPVHQALLTEALDEETRAAILRFVMPNGPWPASDDCSRIIRGLTTGRVAQ